MMRTRGAQRLKATPHFHLPGASIEVMESVPLPSM